MENFLISTHMSSLSTALTPLSAVIRTTRQQLPLPHPLDHNNIPAEHAIFASIVDAEATGTILLRLIQGGLIVELVSLSTDVQPLRLVFPSVLLNNPAVFLEDQELHVLAVTEFGSLYRVIVPLQDRDLWKNQAENVWPKEYVIKDFPQNTRGCFVQAQGIYCVAISIPNGSLLRLDADSLGYDGHEEEWTETVFHHGSFLSQITSLLPSLHSNHPNSADIVSMATHSWPSDVPHVWTLSRDRTLRFWKGKQGCVSSKQLPYISHSLDSSRASSSTPAGSTRSHPLLEEARQNLLKVFTHTAEHGDQLYALAFIPSTSSLSYGGFFCLFDAGRDQLRELAIIECSRRTVHCHLQDFIVDGSNLVTLWENQGRSTVETTNLDFEGYSAGETQTHIWQTAAYAQEPELTPAYMEERLLSPGSLAEKFLEAIFQPGVFSSLSLRAAIDQYTEACLSLPGAPPPQLMGTYSTLAENVAAVVGCTVTLHKDPQSGAFQYANYWTALKRDWEGFVARCREVERSARWPLLLASRHAGEPIIIERERAGCIIIQDTPVYLHRLSKAERVTDPNANIFAAAEALRQKLGPEIMSDLESRLLDMMHQEFAFSLLDILQDQANKLQIWEVLDEGSASWIEGRLQSIDNWDDTLQTALQHIGALEYAVKAEEMETDLTTVEAQSDWFRLLTTRYISVVVEARYELSLSLMTIFLYISRELSSSKAAFVGEVFAVFKGAAMLRYVAAQPAERPSKDGSESSFSEDDVVSRLRNMDVSHNRIPASAPTSVVYLLLTQSSDHGVSVPALAHNLLDNTGLLRSVSPSVATTYEVQFCERIRLLGFFEVARELLSCLPRTPASVFVLAQVWLQTGRFDEAAHLFEKLAGSFGPDSALLPEDVLALTAVLPVAQAIESEFQYYVHISELFKAHHLVSSEVHFAQLAISTAPPFTDTSSLWSVVTKSYADLALYEEAYAALMATPYEKQKREFAGQLVLRMCEENAVARLMAFDFAGISEEVESILSFKARNVDPRQQPNYSRILYTWFIRRGEYRNAALTMYQRALKLQDITTTAQLFVSFGEEQLDSLSIAINALTLVDENSQWVILPVIPDASRKRKGSSKFIPETKFISAKYDSQIVHLAEMQRQHTLLSAQIATVKRNPDILASSEFLLPPTVLVLRLTHHSLFSQALTVASSLKVDMTEIFQQLTTQCIRLSKNPQAVTPLDSDWLLTDNPTTWSGSPADRAWRFLRQSLGRYDGAHSDYQYAKVSLESILQVDRSSPPPPWLVQLIETHHPEYLVRLSLRYEKADDAVTYLLSLLRKSDQRLTRESNQENSSSTWLPYGLVDQVMVAASSLTSTPSNLAQLRTEVANRMKRVLKLSHVESC